LRRGRSSDKARAKKDFFGKKRDAGAARELEGRLFRKREGSGGKRRISGGVSPVGATEAQRWIAKSAPGINLGGVRKRGEKNPFKQMAEERRGDWGSIGGGGYVVSKREEAKARRCLGQRTQNVIFQCRDGEA